jgi:hypothetical protein
MVRKAIPDTSYPIPDHDLNFFAFGTFSPLRMRSAPTAFPSPGQPYFGPNTLFHTRQELADISKKPLIVRMKIDLDVFIPPD